MTIYSIVRQTETDLLFLLKELCLSPGQMAQLVGTLSHAPKGAGSIPGQGTYLGCRFHPQSARVWETTD